jgi:hypothetical protein
VLDAVVEHCSTFHDDVFAFLAILLAVGNEFDGDIGCERDEFLLIVFRNAEKRSVFTSASSGDTLMVDDVPNTKPVFDPKIS